jgi:Ca-activated chloride channel family protein
VLDEGVPQEVAFFGDEELPLDVVFLFDASQSVRFRQQFQREALSAFLRTLLRPDDSAAVIWFSNRVRVEQDFTSHAGLLMSAIDRIPSGGATALYAALAAASERVGARRGRRAIVVLSDGRDTFSDLRLEGALELAQRADAVVYAVNTSYARWAVTPEFRRNDPLEYLASETGGEVYYTAHPDDVEQALSRLSGRLRERYMLGFYPTHAGEAGRFHRITVRVARKDARVEARSGYYAR